MDWIKKHVDQFVLALASLVLLGSAGFLIFKTTQFGDNFSAVQNQPARNDKVKEQDLGKIKTAMKQLESPVTWQPGDPDHEGLFVANQYQKDTSGTALVAVAGGKTHPPVPNNWLRKYGLNVLSPNVLEEDPDKDGFSNLVEYLGADRSEKNDEADATNPKDPKSFPPYYVQLWLKEWIKVRFRLKFSSITSGNPAKDKKEDLEFQINTIDLRTPSAILKLGGTIEGTTYKLVDFQYKTQRNESVGEDEDVSELTLENAQGEKVVLVLNKETDSPDSYALFDYNWPQAQNPQQIKVKKLGIFVLKPEINKQYKLIDIKETEALIQLPSGEQVTVPAPKK